MIAHSFFLSTSNKSNGLQGDSITMAQCGPDGSKLLMNGIKGLDLFTLNAYALALQLNVTCLKFDHEGQ